jgi:carbon storage regulator CsrA
MLIVRRRVGERIVISGGIEITIAAASGGGVRLAVHAPRGVAVVRGEVHDAIAAANAAAAESPAIETACDRDSEGDEESRHAT